MIEPYDQRAVAAMVVDFYNALGEGEGLLDGDVRNDLAYALGLQLIEDPNFFVPALPYDDHTQLTALLQTIEDYESRAPSSLDFVGTGPDWTREVDQLLALIAERSDGQQVLDALDGALDDADEEYGEPAPQTGPRPLIAIAGRKYAGKSTLANSLSAAFNIPVVGFSQRLKMGMKALGVTVTGPHKDVEALQVIGTDFFRNRNPNHWVDLFAEDWDGWVAEGYGLVIDDLRFPNELAWCRAHGFALLYLDVSRAAQCERAQAMGIDPTTINFTHSSEDQLLFDRFDAIIGTDYLTAAGVLGSVSSKLGL